MGGSYRVTEVVIHISSHLLPVKAKHLLDLLKLLPGRSRRTSPRNGSERPKWLRSSHPYEKAAQGTDMLLLKTGTDMARMDQPERTELREEQCPLLKNERCTSTGSQHPVLRANSHEYCFIPVMAARNAPKGRTENSVI